MLNKKDTYKWIAKVLDKYQVVKKCKIFYFSLVDISNSISLGCFDWPFIIVAKIIVLIWCCVFKWIFSRKILILNTDTSVFFRYWYWYCFSIFQIEYWYWYFSILKAYWILVLLFCTGQCSGQDILKEQVSFYTRHNLGVHLHLVYDQNHISQREI